MPVLGSGEEVLPLILKMSIMAKQKYGISYKESLTWLMHWVNVVQASGKWDDTVGKCRSCGAPAAMGRTKCEECLKKRREYFKRYKERKRNEL